MQQTRQDPEDSDPEKVRIGTLTVIELEVISLVCRGLRNKNIGQHLGINGSIVEQHIGSILRKLDLRNRLELVLHAYRHGLTETPDEQHR